MMDISRREAEASLESAINVYQVSIFRYPSHTWFVIKAGGIECHKDLSLGAASFILVVKLVSPLMFTVCREL